METTDFAIVISYGRYFATKNSVYCFEPLGDVLKYNLQSYYNIPDDKFFNDISEVPENTPVLQISAECFDIPKDIVDIILKEYETCGDVRAFDSRNNMILAEITSSDNPNCKYFSVGYNPVQNFRELRERNKISQDKIIERLEKNGVQFVSLDGVGVSPFARIESGTIIYQDTMIRGKSKVGKNTILGPNTIIDNSTIGENCVINSTQIYLSTLEDNVKIGPFCHIRPNSVIKSGVKIGDFVEVKNSVIGENTHASHLAYIGDSDVGKNVNFGCGCVTVNYDGINKARCTIGDRAFIGCNTNLVAPVVIGDDAFTAAGSTLTKDVPSGALAVSRAREQHIIDGWVEKHRTKNK